jgi:hypothetical protein
MLAICETIAPVLRVHCNFDIDAPCFWPQLQGVMTALTRVALPPPTSDFARFVLLLFTFRDLVKPRTVPHCLLYVSQFCVGTPDAFFLAQLPYVLWEPELIVRVFDHLHRTEEPHWVGFVSRTGSVERFYDLFVTHLALPKGEVLAQQSPLRLVLAHLLTDLVLGYREMAMHGRLAASLFKAVLGLIEGFTETCAVPYVRCFVRIADFLLEAGRAYVSIFEEKADRILKITQKTTVYRSYLYAWLVSRLRLVQRQFATSMLMRWGSLSVNTFQLIGQLAARVPLETVHSIVAHLARCMLQRPIWTRTAGHYLLQIFSSDKYDDVCKDWFLEYIRLSFMFVRLASSLKRYRRRLLIWLSCISETFVSIDWLQRSMHENASLCYSADCAILAAFFPCEAFPDDGAWQADFQRFQTFRVYLKTLPFKPSLSTLVRVRPVSAAVLDARISQEIAAFSLSPLFSKWFFFDAGQRPFDQRCVIADLEDYRDDEIARVEALEAAARAFSVPLAASEAVLPRPLVRGVAAAARGCEADLAGWQRKQLTKFCADTERAIAALRAHPALALNLRALTKQHDRDKTSHRQFLQLHIQRRRVQAAVENMASVSTAMACIAPALRSELTTAMLAFVPASQYSPPSPLESFLASWLAKDEERALVEAIVLIVNSCLFDSMVNTVTELANRLFDQFGTIGTSQVFVAVFTALVRVLFDEAYTAPESVLAGFRDENIEFTRVCEERGRQLCQTLGLSDGVLPPANRRKPISVVFGHKRMPNLIAMAFQTNPIDILWEIQCTLQTFRNKMSGMGGDEDEIGLLMGAVVAAPPPNAISIVKVLGAWERLPVAGGLAKPRKAFIEAVRRVQGTRNAVR